MTLSEEFEELLYQCRGAFKQTRTFKRARSLAYGLVNCTGKRTLSGMITANGNQFVDWSSDYRLFKGLRLDTDELFSIIRKRIQQEHLSAESPIYAHMDDTLLKKTGTKVSGTSWRRDPLGPPFHTNFIWGQRFLQLSISLPEKQEVNCRSRAIPVDFMHCPTAKKPKKNAPEEAWKEYKENKKRTNISGIGAERVRALRDNLTKDGLTNKGLIVSVDGSFTNEKLLRDLPAGVTVIGRIRKDAKLNSLPAANQQPTGRKRIYGQALPTPEEIRNSDHYPWQRVEAWATGKTHNFKIKVIDNVRWRKSGGKNLKLVVISPLGYRLTKNSRMLYRQPAYLICTDPKLNIQKLLQAYLWRWEIEVNFRDEKTLLGCGEAQVRQKESVEKLPEFIVAVYAMILLAAEKTNRDGNHEALPTAKWYPERKHQRQSTNDIINTMKTQIWTRSIGISFSDFVNIQKSLRSRRNRVNPTISANFYSRN